jgi:hypothetical protein
MGRRVGRRLRGAPAFAVAAVVALAASAVLAVAIASPVAAIVEDTDLEAAIMQMPAPRDDLVPCEANGPTGRIELDDLVVRSGRSLDAQELDAITESGIIMYRQTWCGDDDLVVEVRGVSTKGREDFGSALLDYTRGLGGDEFDAPLADSAATSLVVPGGVVHQVSFARNGRFFAAAAFIDDDAGRDIAIATAQQLEPRARALNSRHDPPPWWEDALVVAGVAAVILGIVFALRGIMRYNRARDRRDRDDPSAPVSSHGSSDPLGFG